MLPTRRIVELRPGPAQVTGRVVGAEPLLAAPISGRPCVYYQVLGRNHVWPWHNRLRYPPTDVGFWLDDGDAQLWVAVPSPPIRPPRADDTEPALTCSLAGEPFRRTIYAGESDELDRLLDPGGPFHPDAYLDTEERIISEGDLLIVSGDVFDEITPHGQAQNYRSPPTRLVLKARALRSGSGSGAAHPEKTG